MCFGLFFLRKKDCSNNFYKVHKGRNNENKNTKYLRYYQNKILYKNAQ